MAVQKSFGGGARSIGSVRKYVISVVFVVVCLLFFQFWTYEQTWSPNHPSTRSGWRKGGLRAMLMKSWDDYRIANTRDLDTILKKLTTLCNSSFDGSDDSPEETSKTLAGECLTKLMAGFPSLQPVPCLTGVYTERIAALENEVDKLADSLENSTNEVDTLAGSLRNSRNEVDTLASSLRNSRNEVGTLASSLRNSTNEVDTLASSLRNSRNEVGTLASSLRNSTNEVDTLASSLRNSTNEVDTLASSLRNARDELDTLGDSLRNSTVFLELKDTRESGQTESTATWFMSSVHSSVHATKRTTGISEEFEFPSEISHGKLLCLMGNNRSDGSQNKYGFAWKGYLPPGATLLPGLTLVADNYWNYNNIWHAMSALVAFVPWGTKNGCAVPERILLYHWGEHVSSMGSWIDDVLHASFGRKLEVEKLEQQKGSGGPPLVCLERAVVNRRGLGKMSNVNRNAMFETIRCKSRKYCGVVMPEATHPHNTRITLLLRSGARAFKNATAVWTAINGACEKVGNCHVEVASVSNMSFCEQVGLMSRTDVVVTTHGAQMTNMMFMSKGSAVMELFPKGWLEYAGVGQYVYAWLASWANLHHEGVWRDPEGPDCPYPTTETKKCIHFHKDHEVGHNETYFAEWTENVLRNFRVRKDSSPPPPSDGLNCTCEKTDRAGTLQ